MSSSVKKKAALIGKKAALISKYGIGFLIFNLIVKGIWLGLIYLIIAFGFDIVSLFEYFGWDSIASFFRESSAGEIGVAYALVELIKPLRIGLSLAMYPFVCHWFKKFRKKTTTE